MDTVPSALMFFKKYYTYTAYIHKEISELQKQVFIDIWGIWTVSWY